LKEGKEFELQRESGSRFHSLGAEKWNAREPITVMYRGSAKKRSPCDHQVCLCCDHQVCLMIADNEEGCKELEEHADR